jgi:hypothetical protein
MDDLRMRGLTFDVKKAAAAISAALGFNAKTTGKRDAAVKSA